MSEVKVNKISPATGTAFTIGDSGDTFTVPSGATIVNSGTATGFGGGKIGQVLQVVKTDTFTSSLQSWVDITDITLAITPTATSSKILVQAGFSTGGISNGYGGYRFDRGGTAIGVGDAAGGSTEQSTMSADVINGANYKVVTRNMTYLDSPSTTSATTYKVQIFSGDTNALYIGRPYTLQSNQDDNYGISTLTLMEVLA